MKTYSPEVLSFIVGCDLNVYTANDKAKLKEISKWAIKKRIPVKPIYDEKEKVFCCPICDSTVTIETKYITKKYNYCQGEDCGHALDWRGIIVL